MRSRGGNNLVFKDIGMVHQLLNQSSTSLNTFTIKKINLFKGLLILRIATP